MRYHALSAAEGHDNCSNIAPFNDNVGTCIAENDLVSNLDTLPYLIISIKTLFNPFPSGELAMSVRHTARPHSTDAIYNTTNDDSFPISSEPIKSEEALIR